jgi:hypothetical protein
MNRLLSQSIRNSKGELIRIRWYWKDWQNGGKIIYAQSEVRREAETEFLEWSKKNVPIKGSPPKKLVIEIYLVNHACRRIYRIGANGMMQKGRYLTGFEDTAHAVWHHHGARVASQRCPILRDGTTNIHHNAVGHKALNPRGLRAKPPTNPPTKLEESPN